MSFVSKPPVWVIDFVTAAWMLGDADVGLTDELCKSQSPTSLSNEM